MHRKTNVLVLAILLAAVAGCASKPPDRIPGAQRPYRIGSNWYVPLPRADGFRERGLASWYGRDFHGRPTASGESYDMYAMTAAHKTLPLGTYVRVRNLRTGRAIDVRINDRGPFVRGRIIDLSYTAAREIGIVGPGTAPVEIAALGPDAKPGRPSGFPKAVAAADYERGSFSIQVGAFRERAKAEKLKNRLDREFEHARVIPVDSAGGLLYRVRVGRTSSLSEARAYEDLLVRRGFTEAIAVAD